MEPTTTCPHLDTLRDAIEFKKLNNNLLKSSFIEECIGDIYAVIYESNAEILKLRETDEEKRTRMRVDNILTSTTSNEGVSEAGANELSGADGTLVQDSMAMYRRKPTSITHREIIRRAEALMVKPPPIVTPKAAVKTLPSLSEAGKSPVVAVIIPTQYTAKEAISVPDSPASIHDSADDESELSDIEDEGDDDDNCQDMGDRKKSMSAPIFPNLLSVKDGEVVGDSASEEVEGYAKRLDEKVDQQDSLNGPSSASKLQIAMSDGHNEETQEGSMEA